jgi:hypothetical protein
VQHLAELEPLRRYATLTAVVLDLTATLTDEALNMFEHLIGKLFKKSERAHADEFHASGKSINEKVRLYARIGKALIAARFSGEDAFAANEAVLPWAKFESTVAEAQILAQPRLNKGEQQNALRRAVFFNQLGEIRDRSYENQRHRASGLNLLVAAIILWNTTYLLRALDHMQKTGVRSGTRRSRPSVAPGVGTHQSDWRLPLGHVTSARARSIPAPPDPCTRSRRRRLTCLNSVSCLLLWLVISTRQQVNEKSPSADCLQSCEQFFSLVHRVTW